MASTLEKLARTIAVRGVNSIAAYNRKRIVAPKRPNPFISGIHAPMRAEVTLDSDHLQVTGHIPVELDGRYLRIGPNPMDANPATHHWFIGDGMVHGVRLSGGKAVWYKNRWLRSNQVSAHLGEEPAPGTRATIGGDHVSDTANTNVIGHAGRIYGIVEAGAYPVELDADLNTVAHNPFDGTLRKSFTAHPHRDPESGELHAITYRADNQTTIYHVVVGTDGRVRREEPITVQHGPMIHDCMITKNYVIILDLPVTFSAKVMMEGYSFPYAWNPAHKARVGLLPRDGRNADVIWCDVDPCAVFHPANAYETDDGRVIMDVCAHDSMFATSRIGPDSQSCPLERWTIDVAARRVDRQLIDQESQEFPRPDERFIGKPYRYAFTVALPKDHLFQQGADTRLFKHDLANGTRTVHDFGPGRHPGEFVFVPRSDAAPEGDGWMIGYVINTADDTSDLVILVANDFGGEPVASVRIPHRIPPGFHGNWVAE